MKSAPTHSARAAAIPKSTDSGDATTPAGTRDPDAPRGCTNYKLRQLQRAVSRLYDAELSLAGLKTTQYSLLLNLSASAPIRPTDLAAQMHMDASTMTRNLHVIVAEGWAQIAPGPDARSRLVSLTRDGEAKLAIARRHWKQAQLKLNARWSGPRVAALHRLIDEGLERLTVGADRP